MNSFTTFKQLRKMQQHHTKAQSLLRAAQGYMQLNDSEGRADMLEQAATSAEAWAKSIRASINMPPNFLREPGTGRQIIRTCP